MSVVLTFESVDQILWCDHSNETSYATPLHGTICDSIFYKIKFGMFLALLEVKRLNVEHKQSTSFFLLAQEQDVSVCQLLLKCDLERFPY